MKICTIAGACVTRIDGIAFSPAGAELHVAHPVYDVVVKGSCTHEVTILALNDFFGNAAESLIGRHKSLRVKISLGGRRLRWINAFLKAPYLILDRDGFSAVFRAKCQEKYAVSMFMLLQYFPLPRGFCGGCRSTKYALGQVGIIIKHSRL